MTLVPECQLAREAQMCYASISTVTDYDVWAEKPVTEKKLESLGYNVDDVIIQLQKNLLQGDLSLPEGLKRESFVDD